jgi:hypothetical protein
MASWALECVHCGSTLLCEGIGSCPFGLLLPQFFFRNQPVLISVTVTAIGLGFVDIFSPSSNRSLVVPKLAGF